ncbi:hypothetical protein LEN26_006717 [Aphanomyces euteiches]|nr:hypothetical protein AeMF1_013703 [Aphanomyces euteiches]KAH9134741.1 hypothetical protein LEN26_006717 [Aphanomyces euteiches]KAH9194674.1 hypothetical protein AeNC1_003348 [Aphanomyces euteiches]
MGWLASVFGDGYVSASFVLGVALLGKAIHESWLAAYLQYEAWVTGGKVRRLARLRYGFWSLLSSHMTQRWIYWLPGVFFILLWLWNRYGPSLWSETEDVIDDSDVPELEPFEPTATTSSPLFRNETTVQQRNKTSSKDNRASQPQNGKHNDDVDANTRRKHAFRALMAQKARFEQLEVKKPKGWLVYDPDKGQLVEVCP